MQCARALPVTWLGSGSCQAQPSRLNTNEWLYEDTEADVNNLIFESHNGSNPWDIAEQEEIYYEDNSIINLWWNRQINWAENTAQSERRRPNLTELLVVRAATLICVQFDLSLWAEIICAERSTAELQQRELAFLLVTQPH